MNPPNLRLPCVMRPPVCSPFTALLLNSHNYLKVIWFFIFIFTGNPLRVHYKERVINAGWITTLYSQSGHGPHLFRIIVFCVVLVIVLCHCLYAVLLLLCCTVIVLLSYYLCCPMYWLCVLYHCHRVLTQFQLTNISVFHIYYVYVYIFLHKQNSSLFWRMSERKELPKFWYISVIHQNVLEETCLKPCSNKCEIVTLG